jgi:hypothetical protein
MTKNKSWIDLISYVKRSDRSESDIIRMAINGQLLIAFDWVSLQSSCYKEKKPINLRFSIEGKFFDSEDTGITYWPSPDKSIYTNRLAVLDEADLSELLQFSKVTIASGMVDEVCVEILPETDDSELPSVTFNNLFVLYDNQDDDTEHEENTNVLQGFTHTSESLIIAAAVVEHFWEGQVPQVANKAANKDAVVAWIKQEFHEKYPKHVSNNFCINIARIVRPFKYK